MFEYFYACFGIVRFFKMILLCHKIRFSQWPSKLYPNFVFFSMQLFSNLFSSKPPPPNFTRNETFCEHRGLLGVRKCDLRFLKFSFFEWFLVEQNVLCVSLRVFWHYKIEF